MAEAKLTKYGTRRLRVPVPEFAYHLLIAASEASEDLSIEGVAAICLRRGLLAMTAEGALQKPEAERHEIEKEALATYVAEFPWADFGVQKPSLS
jgi:hypothetical protein